MNTLSTEYNLKDELSIKLPINSVPEDLYSIFCETMQNDLSQLDDAINKHDIISIRALSHRMKGAFEVLGISAGTSACKKIGHLLQKTDVDQIKTICVDLQYFLSNFID